MTIKPRPTYHPNAQVSPDFYRVFSVDKGRAEAWCPCGTRLSRYRAAGDIWCAPCQAKRVVPAEELHPESKRHQPPRSAMCPECGGPMHRSAKRCAQCFRRLWSDA